MNVDEAIGLCKDRSRWRSVVSAYPHGKKACFCILKIQLYYLGVERRTLRPYVEFIKNDFCFKMKGV